MLSIGKLSEKCGVKVATIRYYEQIGLLPEGVRTAGNQRRYDGHHLERLSFIRHARELGFSIEAIRGLIELANHPMKSCAEVDAIAVEHLKAVERKIEKLSKLKNELNRMIQQCGSNSVESCNVLEVIADHSQCDKEH